ncbi:MAG: hypothetical protein VYC17_05525 [Nitrospinota bacterium]|nr:hypothetical protein [Nitrospinota bacterium]
MISTKGLKKFLCIDDDRATLIVTRQIVTKVFSLDRLEFSVEGFDEFRPKVPNDSRENRRSTAESKSSTSVEALKNAW